jgi:O6-methylguanine-DNA--protein-cysteine methyltransferase
MKPQPLPKEIQMNNDTVRLSISISTIAVAIAAKQYIRIHREERAKRKEIQRNMRLDIQAIHNAHDVMIARINNGEIRSLAQLAEATHTEVAFHKIAIREED